MTQFDENRLKAAITYISRMAEGNHPVNNRPANSEILDNPNVIRCLHFVKEVLQEVRDNKGCVGRAPKAGKNPFPFEVLGEFHYREDKTLSRLLGQFAEPVKDSNVKLPGAASVNKWLAAKGYLRRLVNQDGNNYWAVTEQGTALGLYEQEGRSLDGRSYVSILYNEQAQTYLAENLERIVSDCEAEAFAARTAKQSAGPPNRREDALAPDYLYSSSAEPEYPYGEKK